MLGCRYDLSSFQSGLVVSASLFGALGGSAAAFVVGDKLGRKRELLLAALLYGELLGGIKHNSVSYEAGACSQDRVLCGCARSSSAMRIIAHQA